MGRLPNALQAPAGAGMVAPVASDCTEDGQAQNRRVEVVALYCRPDPPELFETAGIGLVTKQRSRPMAHVAAEGHFQGGSGHISPTQIAHHPLFTAREKLDLLYQLRAEIADSDRDLGLDPEEIDLAIEDVKRNVESGQGSEPALLGDG